MHPFILKAYTMNAWSTSFLSAAIPRQNLFLPIPATPPKPSPSPHFHVSAIRISPLGKSESATTAVAAAQQQNPSLLVRILNAFDDFIVKSIDPPLQPSFDTKYILSGNFAPVDELPPTECDVISGTLPACLDGVYIRNGPNPQFIRTGPYHLFEGDGMLHSVRISNGRATLCSRFVKTYRYTVEKNVGYPVIPNVFSGFHNLAGSVARAAVATGRFLAGQYNPINGVGLANTSVAFIGGKLYALGESDLPYAVKVDPDGEIITVGPHDFDGKLLNCMTAHPKIDADTGEAFAFRFSPFRPFLTYFWFDKTGSKQPDVPIFSMTNPSFLHDFAITKNYGIFADIQVQVNVMEMVRGGSLVGADLTKVPKLGVIPRYAKDDAGMRWFEVGGLNMFHGVNAWEEDDGDTVVLVGPNIFPVEHSLERMDLIHTSLESVRIDLKTGVVSRHPLSCRNVDFCTINPAFAAKKSRYMYGAIGDPWPIISGIVKLDLSLAEGDQRECVTACHMFGHGCYGGEPFFVAREPNNPDADEDDGYLLSFVHDENAGESMFLVMDAKSPTLETIAEVKLPSRVPYGFHGIFVRESDLNMTL